MIKEHVTLNEVIDLFNELLHLDNECITKMCKTRTICNSEIADHPSVQVGVCEDDNQKFDVGIVGLINGLFGTFEDGWGNFCAVYDVICKNGCQVERGKVTGHICKHCGEKLLLGNIIKFKKTRRE